MTHQISTVGIVGLGALGRALETFVAPLYQSPPGAVLFCTKAFDLEAALEEQANHWPIEVPFVVMCNGYVWPIVERQARNLNGRPVRIGMTTIGSTIDESGALKIFSKDTITAWGPWGNFKDKPAKTELDLLRAFPNSSWHDDIRPMIRQKWILNVVINTLGGAYRLPSNSHVQAHRDEAEMLLKEALDLSQKLFPGVSSPITLDEMREKLWSLVKATGGNENSMAKDVRLKKLTESEFLAGIALDFDDFPTMKRLHLKIIKG